MSGIESLFLGKILLLIVGEDTNNGGGFFLLLVRTPTMSMIKQRDLKKKSLSRQTNPYR